MNKKMKTVPKNATPQDIPVGLGSVNSVLRSKEPPQAIRQQRLCLRPPQSGGYGVSIGIVQRNRKRKRIWVIHISSSWNKRYEY